MRKVYESANLIDAKLVSDRLQLEGIDNRIKGELLTGGIGELPANTTPSVWVVDENLEELALEMIGGWQRAACSEASDWQCPRCGEVQDGSFELCWRCGAERPGQRASPDPPG